MPKIGLGYTLRWQVALVCKAWKSSANLHAFATENAHIAAALLWASLAASALQRFFAHAAEHRLEVVVSTRQAAMTPA
jgi:HrpA-like RNA helicase